jgi:uncharacterized protein
MIPTLRRLAALGTLAVLALLHACAPAPGIRPAPPELAAPSLDAAEQAENAADYVIASREYQRLAERAEPPQRQNYQLKSVAALIKAAQVREARERLARVDVARLDPSFTARKRILEAQLAALEGVPDQTLRLLTQAEAIRNLDPSLSAEIHRVRAEAHIALGRPLRAVADLIAREQFMVNPEALTHNQRQLWHILEALSYSELRQALTTARDPVLIGWLELAIAVIENASTQNRLSIAVDGWRKTHPLHPITDTFLQALASPAAGVIGRIDRIALLLPLSSEHGQAAQAVRDGFLAMHAANTRPDKPAVRVYDIGADPGQAPAYYRSAVADGAQLVVGPLGLEAVDQVVRKADLNAPTLLLSHTTQELRPSARHVFQFGLPPEQEATQAAERAYLDGHRHAAVLYPETSWGQRMADAFTDAWQRLGGIVLTTESYLQDQGDYSEPVKRLLNINQSEQRRQAVEAALRSSVKFDARPREDVDFVFLAADARRARLIKPQLNYHRAGRLPVYATSHVFTGRGNAMTDIDLDGIMFGDMPWILVGDGRIQDLRATLQRGWPYAHSQLDRLYALGVDAYAIVPQLNRISTESAVHFSGVTSGLSLGRSNRLQRQLLWARFRKGVPQLIDTFFKHKNQFEVDDGSAPGGEPRT